MRDRNIIQWATLLCTSLFLLGATPGSAAKWAKPGDGLEKRTLQWDGQEREYWIHYPPDFDGEQSPPLVIALHGGGGLGENFDRSTEGTLTAATDQRGMVVVFPQGIDRRWNDGREVIFRKRGKNHPKYDDVGFISALIDALAEETGIDKKRVYATGISNGGFLSYRLALELSDKVAAVAPVTAQISKAMERSTPEHPVSIMVVNGTEDPLVPYSGGHVRLVKRGRSRGEILSTDETIQRFRQHNQCDAAPVIEEWPDLDPKDGTRITRETYSGGVEGTEVILIQVQGGGHTWPQGRQYLSPRVVGVVSRDINASELIVDFFSRHSLQGNIAATPD